MSKINRLKTFLLVCVFTLSVPLFAFAEEFASNDDSEIVPYEVGQWDLMGTEVVTFAYTKETMSKTYYAVDEGNF